MCFHVFLQVKGIVAFIAAHVTVDLFMVSIHVLVKSLPCTTDMGTRGTLYVLDFVMLDLDVVVQILPLRCYIGALVALELLLISIRFWRLNDATVPTCITYAF